MRDTGMLLQGTSGYLAGYQFRLMQRDQYVIDMIIIGDLRHTFAISAVSEDQQFILRTHGSPDRSLHTIRSATLQQDTGVLIPVQSRYRQQAFTDRGNDTLVIILIPRTPILKHGLTYRLRRTQRARCQ